jgi:hypothetical protein
VKGKARHSSGATQKQDGFRSKIQTPSIELRYFHRPGFLTHDFGYVALFCFRFDWTSLSSSRAIFII